MSEATAKLDAIGKGDAEAPAALFDLLYHELRRLAAHRMAGEAPGQTLQATALVHEAWLRLVGDGNRRFEDRTHNANSHPPPTATMPRAPKPSLEALGLAL